MKYNYYKNACPQCLKHSFCRRGLSAVELLVVFAILGIILVVAIPRFSGLRETQVVKGAIGDILSSLSKARTQTLASIDSSSYGVHFEEDEVIIFKGTNFVPNDSNNEEVAILSPATISNVTLNGASGTSGELYFSRLSGAPSKNGTVTISSSNFSRIITITATGSASAD